MFRFRNALLHTVLDKTVELLRLRQLILELCFPTLILHLEDDADVSLCAKTLKTLIVRTTRIRRQLSPQGYGPSIQMLMGLGYSRIRIRV